MRSLLFSSVCIALALNASIAVAQMDLIGTYFDENATTHCLPDGVGSIHNVYIVLQNISCPSGLLGWQGTLDVDAGLLVGTVTLRHGGINYANGSDLVVAFGSPVPAAANIVLAQIEIYASSAGGVWFGRLAYDEYSCPVYLEGNGTGILRPTSLAFGGESVPTAVVGNIDCPASNSSGSVGSSRATWGTVKALFR
jgi:hypothetical protein